MRSKDILNAFQVKKAKQRRFWSIFIFFVFIFVIINLILNFILFSVKQKSISMEPDIPADSIIMTSPLPKDYGRGDVVVMKSFSSDCQSIFSKIGNLFTKFFTAQQVSLTEKSGVPGTKQKLRRIVGMPGDTIYMRDYVLYIKPQNEKHFLTEFELTDKPYNVTFYVAPANWDNSIGAKGSFDEIYLDKNQYFVLADNRKATDDSRLWGPVTVEDMASKALFCYFPFDNLKFF